MRHLIMATITALVFGACSAKVLESRDIVMGVRDLGTSPDVASRSDLTPSLDLVWSPDTAPSFHTIGCADGTREGFADVNRWPAIAGCAAGYVELTPCPTGAVGANDGKYGCSACAAGWHICSTPPGDSSSCPYLGPTGADYTEVTSRATYYECKAQPGFFAAGAVFATSNHPCGVASMGQNHFGCGTDTGGNGGATGTDCTGYPALANLNCNSDTNTMGATLCLGGGASICSSNIDSGTAPHFRGVLCCR